MYRDSMSYGGFHGPKRKHDQLNVLPKDKIETKKNEIVPRANQQSFVFFSVEYRKSQRD